MTRLGWCSASKAHQFGNSCHLTMVCSANAGPEVRNSIDAVNEARAAPERCRMCLAQRPVVHKVGSAAGKGLQRRRCGDESPLRTQRRCLDNGQGYPRISALKNSQRGCERLCTLQISTRGHNKYLHWLYNEEDDSYVPYSLLPLQAPSATSACLSMQADSAHLSLDARTCHLTWLIYSKAFLLHIVQVLVAAACCCSYRHACRPVSATSLHPTGPLTVHVPMCQCGTNAEG